MPEGPSVRRWGDIARRYIHKIITEVKGCSKIIDHDGWTGACINEVYVYGKQLFFQLVKSCPVDRLENRKRKKSPGQEKKTISLEADTNSAVDLSIWYRYHFLMWGSLRENEYKGPSKRSKTQKAPNPMVELHFEDESFLVFYGGSIRVVDGPCEDEGTDVLSSTFNIAKATAALMEPSPVCYTIMDQTHFAGAGNIVKNEVLYACRIHPLELGSNLTQDKATELATEVVSFTQNWLKWEAESSGYQRFGSWLEMYWKFKCPNGHKTIRGWFGNDLKRMTTWCPECQPLRVESDISKSELEDVGKIKKTTRVGEQANRRDEDEEFESEQVSKKKKGERLRESTSKRKKNPHGKVVDVPKDEPIHKEQSKKRRKDDQKTKTQVAGKDSADSAMVKKNSIQFEKEFDAEDDDDFVSGQLPDGKSLRIFKKSPPKKNKHKMAPESRTKMHVKQNRSRSSHPEPRDSPEDVVNVENNFLAVIGNDESQPPRKKRKKKKRDPSDDTTVLAGVERDIVKENEGHELSADKNCRKKNRHTEDKINVGSMTDETNISLRRSVRLRKN